MSKRLRPSTCSNCGYVSDAADDMSGCGLTPEPGNLSLCLGCAHVAKYDDGLYLVELTTVELVELALDEDFVEMQQSAKRKVAQIWAGDTYSPEVDGPRGR